MLVKCVGCLKEGDNDFWHENYSIDGSRTHCNECCRIAKYLSVQFRLHERSDRNGKYYETHCVRDGCLKPISRSYSQIYTDNLLCRDCRLILTGY